MTKLWIIADDYGLGAKHDAVIRSLIASRSINATSVLVDLCSEDSAKKLVEMRASNVRIGLHLNLTLSGSKQRQLPRRSFLLAGCMLGLNRSVARSSLQDQWDRFLKLFGSFPDYIDGHEHCHAFPGVRTAVLDKAEEHGVAVRSMIPLKPNVSVKSHVIAGLGQLLARDAKKRGVKTNWRFGGVLPLQKPENAIIRQKSDLSAATKLAVSAPGEIWFMVHPGDAKDPVQVPGHPAQLREMEAKSLAQTHLVDVDH